MTMLIRNLAAMTALVVVGFAALLLTLPTPKGPSATTGTVVIENIHYSDGDALPGPTRLALGGGHGTQLPVHVDTLAHAPVRVVAHLAEGADVTKLAYLPEWERRASGDDAFAYP